jgi:hypothetical protein
LFSSTFMPQTGSVAINSSSQDVVFLSPSCARIFPFYPGSKWLIPLTFYPAQTPLTKASGNSSACDACNTQQGVRNSSSIFIVSAVNSLRKPQLNAGFFDSP